VSCPSVGSASCTRPARFELASLRSTAGYSGQLSYSLDAWPAAVRTETRDEHWESRSSSFATRSAGRRRTRIGTAFVPRTISCQTANDKSKTPHLLLGAGGASLSLRIQVRLGLLARAPSRPASCTEFICQWSIRVPRHRRGGRRTLVIGERTKCRPTAQRDRAPDTWAEAQVPAVGFAD
jgi:hypothetical protein